MKEHKSWCNVWGDEFKPCNCRGYVRWHRFLAWVGFAAIIFIIAGIITAVVLANYYLAANGI